MTPVWLKLLPAFLRARIEHRATLQKALANTGWLFGDKILRMGGGAVSGRVDWPVSWARAVWPHELCNGRCRSIWRRGKLGAQRHRRTRFGAAARWRQHNVGHGFPVAIYRRLLAVPVAGLKFVGALLGKCAAVARLTGPLHVDSSAIRARLGWKPPFSMEAGLAATVAARV